MSKILSDFLNLSKPSPRKSPTISRPRITFQQWRADHPINPHMALMRSASVFIGAKGQAVVSRSQQAIKSEANGARVVFHASRFSKTQEKPSLTGVLSALEGNRAA